MCKCCNSKLKDALNGQMTKIEKLPLKTPKDIEKAKNTLKRIAVEMTRHKMDR